jgi:hypothetical protein
MIIDDSRGTASKPSAEGDRVVPSRALEYDTTQHCALVGISSKPSALE